MTDAGAPKKAEAKEVAPKNTNRWDTRQLVTMAVLIAIGTLISFIEIPIIPGVEFLKYDPSAVAMLVGTFIFGPFAGGVIGTLIALLHGSASGFWGVFMNIVAMLSMGVPAGLVYRRNKTRKGAAIALGKSNPAEGALVVLVANVVLIIAASTTTLAVQRRYTRRSSTQAGEAEPPLPSERAAA